MAELPEFCARFLIYCNRKLTKLTACGYLYEIRHFFVYYAAKVYTDIQALTIESLSQITVADVEEWLASHEGKVIQNTIIRKYSTINTFLGYYFKQGCIDKNVTEQIDMPKIKDKPIKTLSRENVAKLFNAVDTYEQPYPQYKKGYEKWRLRDRTILMFFLCTGVRVSELVGLNIKDVNLNNGSYTITRKGGKIETQYLTEELHLQLLYYLDSIDTSNENAPLFSSRDNPRIADNTIRDMLKKYCEHAGIEVITPHTLRRTFGTNLYRQIRDIFAVAQVLGHTSVNTTRKHYANIDEDIKRNAIKGFSLDRL